MAKEKLFKLVADITKGTQEYVEYTPAEIAERDQMIAQAEADNAARLEAEEAKANLKASAKAKLVAGEPLTDEEAETIVL